MGRELATRRDIDEAFEIVSPRYRALQRGADGLLSAQISGFASSALNSASATFSAMFVIGFGVMVFGGAVWAALLAAFVPIVVAALALSATIGVGVGAIKAHSVRRLATLDEGERARLQLEERSRHCSVYSVIEGSTITRRIRVGYRVRTERLQLDLSNDDALAVAARWAADDERIHDEIVRGEVPATNDLETLAAQEEQIKTIEAMFQASRAYGR
jgi:hypothetical protein